jgi:hypothetical protein
MSVLEDESQGQTGGLMVMRGIIEWNTVLFVYFQP